MDHYLTTKPNSYFLWFTRDMTSWLAIAVHNEFWGFYKVLSMLMVTGNNELSYSGACVLIMGWVNSNCILCNRAATSITTVSSLSYQTSARPIWLTQPQSVVCTHSAHKLHNEIHSLHDIFPKEVVWILIARCLLGVRSKRSWSYITREGSMIWCAWNRAFLASTRWAIMSWSVGNT